MDTPTNCPTGIPALLPAPRSPPRPCTPAANWDVLAVDLLWGTVDVLTRAGCHEITVDLAELLSIDAAGVKVLLALQHSFGSHSDALTVINARPEVRAALEHGQVSTRPLLSDDDS